MIRSAPRRLRIPLLLALAAGVAACQATGKGRTPSSDDDGPARPRVAAEPEPVSDALSFEPYDGAFARDRAVGAFRKDAAAAATAVADRLKAETGLSFLPGRAPRLRFSDEADAPSGGAVEMRMTGGVRRAEIVVAAASVASGEFRAKDHLAMLVAEAALLSAQPERAPPDWLRAGFPVFATGRLEQRVLEAAVGGDAVRTTPAAFDPLLPAFRTAALARIAVGERGLARYLQSRLNGADELAALREVGVEDIEFLDAATETERNRALRDLRDDEALGALAAARAVLSAGDAAAAAAQLAAGDAALARAPQQVRSDADLVRAEIALARKDRDAATTSLDAAFTGGFPVRVTVAHRLRLAADAASADRAAEFLRWHADDASAAALCDEWKLPYGAVVAATHAAPDARAASVRRIAAAKAPAGTAFLRRAMRDGDARVRRAAVEGLGASGDGSVKADLQAATEDDDATVRSAAQAILAPAPVKEAPKTSPAAADKNEKSEKPEKTAAPATSAPKATDSAASRPPVPAPVAAPVTAPAQPSPAAPTPPRAPSRAERPPVSPIPATRPAAPEAPQKPPAAPPPKPQPPTPQPSTPQPSTPQPSQAPPRPPAPMPAPVKDAPPATQRPPQPPPPRTAPQPGPVPPPPPPER